MKVTEILEISEDIQGSYRYDILTQEEWELLSDIDSIRLKMEAKLRKMQQILPGIKTALACAKSCAVDNNDNWLKNECKDLLTKIEKWEND